MNNEELLKAIALCFNQCIESYSRGREYGGTAMYQDSLKAMQELLVELTNRAKDESCK